MSTADPNTTPPDEKEPSSTALFLGSFLVDGILQCGMSFWLKWILGILSPYTYFNVWAFWLGSVIFYMTLYRMNSKLAGKTVVYHAFAFLLITIFIRIFQ